MNIRRLSTLLLAACTFFFHPSVNAQLQVVGDGGPGPVKAQHLTAELVSVAPGIAPGGTLQAGLVLTLEEPWHVYWSNAGDSGNIGPSSGRTHQRLAFRGEPLSVVSRGARDSRRSRSRC